MLRVLAQKPNILLLDEPTNDLDAVTVDSLEKLLQEWAGALIMVSHDRSLLDGVCNSFIVFSKGENRPRRWYGTYAELVQAEKDKTRHKSAACTTAEAVASGRCNDISSTKDRQKAEKKLKQVEGKIEKLEAELDDVVKAMELAAADAAKMMELHAHQQKLEEEQT